MKVFITDAMYKHTLGAVRSLGKRGVYIVAGWPIKYATSFYSRYCRERVIYPNPEKEDEFVNFMMRFVKNNKIDVLVPIGYDTATTLSKYKEEFCRYTKLPVADWDSMKIACNKEKSFDFAEKLGIKIPKIYHSPEEIQDFPVVVKGITEKETKGLRYINSPEELLRTNITGSLMQEYIRGEGYGFYALFNKGNIKAFFMLRRIRQYPVTGGSSTVAESIYDPELKDQGITLLKALNWHGVAMVEFKRDSRDGEFKLMEINPKFWGSLDLAIACGVDFPYLTVKMAEEGDVEPVFDYDVGVKFRWLFPDVLHLLANPGSAGAFIRDFLDKNTKNDIWISDVKPNLFQSLLAFYELFSNVRKKQFKYPHGTPKE